MKSTDFIVIGGGIVGLAIARDLASNGRSVTVIEKEASWGSHQTGRNSGVIHAGPYYKPGSLKASLCVEGNRLMVDFAKEHGIPFKVTGKLLLATSKIEEERLSSLASKAKANNVPAELIGKSQVQELEPHAAGIAALHVKSTGIIDYGLVAKKLASQVEQQSGEMILGSKARTIREENNKIVVEHELGISRGTVLINAAGLHRDSIAKLAGVRPQLRIIPFRGEYFELTPEKRHLVNGLIYPVPDPALPFLGVHLTRMINGDVHAGPNAVLALAKEGYTWSDVNLSETLSSILYPGFQRLALRNIGTGAMEIMRSLSKERFARDLRRLVPSIQAEDLVVAPSGVRAQAVDRKGKLVDDFVIETRKNQVHILNAPSPAATASLAIALYVTSKLL